MVQKKPSKGAVRVPHIIAAKNTTRISALTAYDYTMAKLIDSAGVDLILVGDSLASVVQGHETTIPVTLDEMIYHCRCVTAGVQKALVVGDLPFMSYQLSAEQALQSAGRLLKEGGVGAVKLEGGEYVAETVNRITNFDIPVMGHVGLTPQSYHRMGGHKLQGKKSVEGTPNRLAGTAEQVMRDALALDEAGVFAIVLEGIPAELARDISSTVSVPTIGIGAGPHCDGQILVSTDMLGLNGTKVPSFVKLYEHLGSAVANAVQDFVVEVKSGAFPAVEQPKSNYEAAGIN